MLPQLAGGERPLVLAITSHMGSIADIDAPRDYAYRSSKAALNAAMHGLAHELKPRGIGVLLLHPGWVGTDMTEGMGIAVEESAAGLVRTMDRLDIGQTGTFWHQEGYELPW